MRNIYSIVAIVAGLSVVLPVQAVETKPDGVQQAHQVQFLSKRSYQQPVVAKVEAEQAWVGATLRIDQVNPQQALKLNTLGKRAY